jgi:hypothetical protein
MMRLVGKPVESVKELIEYSKVVYTAAEDIALTAIHAPQYGVGGTIKQVQNVFIDLGTITSLAKDKEHAQKINHATELSGEELEKTLDNQFDYQQERGGIPADKKARVHLYQGDNQAFDEGAAKDLRNYKGGYDKKNNKVYINSSKTDISNGSDIQQVLFTEQQRKETHDSSLLNKLSSDQQKKLAYDRGDRAAKNWARFSNLTTKTDSVVVNSWNERNKDSLKENNEWIGGVDGTEVKPRFDMENDPDIRKLLSTAEGLKLWRSFMPVLGSGEAAVDAFGEEKYILGSLHTLSAVLEAIPLVRLVVDGIEVVKAGKSLVEVAKQVEKTREIGNAFKHNLKLSSSCYLCR